MIRTPRAPLIARTPAKLNLGLWIVRRRADGYHDLLTIFQAIDLFDTLEARPAGRGFRLSTNRRGLPTDHRNLVIRAARAFDRETGTRGGVEFHLTKRIPLGAGLGGGSSDAAATLLLLDRLRGTALSDARLAAIAARVGSDVPFFIRGGRQLGRGRGTRLLPLESEASLDFVVVHGPEPIGTKWAYSRYERELTRSGPPHRIRALAQGGRIDRASRKHLANHLEAGLVPDFPDIGERQELLRASGAEVSLLTGSGSSVFGIFASRHQAARACQRVTRQGWKADLCRSIPGGVVVGG